jgi:hypothetical protein
MIAAAIAINCCDVSPQNSNSAVTICGRGVALSPSREGPLVPKFKKKLAIRSRIK